MFGCTFLNDSMMASSNDFWNVDPEPASFAVTGAWVVAEPDESPLDDALCLLLDPHAAATSPMRSTPASRRRRRDFTITDNVLSWTIGGWLLSLLRGSVRSPTVEGLGPR